MTRTSVQKLCKTHANGQRVDSALNLKSDEKFFPQKLLATPGLKNIPCGFNLMSGETLI